MLKIIIILFIFCVIGTFLLLLFEVKKEREYIKEKANQYTIKEIENRINELEEFLIKTKIKGELLENTLDQISFWERVLEQKQHG